ncbi:hypothetical protein Hte_004183 [Hypoxylon texense]
MRQSLLTCGETRIRTNCTDCVCAEPVQILLEAGCHLPCDDVRYLLSHFVYYSLGSTKAIFTMLEHIKMWRDKLKALLFEHIPEMKLSERYSSSILDQNAGEAIDKLERNGIFPYREYGLQPDDYRLGDRGGATVYHFINYPWVAEKAFGLGFRDLEEHWDGRTPLMKHSHDLKISRPFIHYIQWLIGGFTNLVPNEPILVDAYLLPKRQVAHLLLRKLGDAASLNQKDGSNEEELGLDCVKLFLKSPTGDGCACGCSNSSHGCYPITIFLSSYFQEYRIRYGRRSDCYEAAIWISEKMLESIAEKDESCAITEAIFRAFTFSCLTFKHGLGHTCCLNLGGNPSLKDIQSYREYHREVRKEDYTLHCKLDDLVAGFMEQFSCETCSFSEFIQGHWVPRMKQAVDELKRPYLSEEEMSERKEEVVVVNYENDENDDDEYHNCEEYND